MRDRVAGVLYLAPRAKSPESERHRAWPAMTEEPRVSRRAIAAWCLYDWANSAFPTVVITFVFAAYFTEAVASDRETGTALWANGQTITAVLIAILSPCLG